MHIQQNQLNTRTLTYVHNIYIRSNIFLHITLFFKYIQYYRDILSQSLSH